MKRFLLILLLLSVFTFAKAQEKIQEQSINSDMTIIFENGLMIGHSSSYYPTPFSSNISFLKNINNRFWIGAGSGAEVIGKTFIPVFADFRFMPISSKPFFIYEKAGATICANKNYADGLNNNNYYYNIYPHPLNEDITTSGGIMNEAGCGILLKNTNWATSISIGYRYQKTKDKTTNNANNTSSKTYENTFNRMAVRIGFWF